MAGSVLVVLRGDTRNVGEVYSVVILLVDTERGDTSGGALTLLGCSVELG